VKIAGGSMVLGREMKRTLNAMQQRFRRVGFGEFAYIWVAENPRDENPHVHLLTNYRVPRSEFEEFCAWVESLWGHGWVPVERIKKPESAGRYILKAVKYALKGDSSEQGTIRGNRYGISRNIQVQEVTRDLYDLEAAAECLVALSRRIEADQDIEQLGNLWLTPYGLSFPVGTTDEDLNAVLYDLEKGVVPG